MRVENVREDIREAKCFLIIANCVYAFELVMGMCTQ